MATSTLQKTNLSLLSLFCAANFDKERIEIIEWELSDNFLTLYLDDKRNPVNGVSDAVMYKLPVSRFSEIITRNGLNTHEGVMYSNSGRPYECRIVINEAVAWFNQDASISHQKDALDLVKNLLLKSSLVN